MCGEDSEDRKQLLTIPIHTKIYIFVLNSVAEVLCGLVAYDHTGTTLYIMRWWCVSRCGDKLKYKRELKADLNDNETNVLINVCYSGSAVLSNGSQCSEIGIKT